MADVTPTSGTPGSWKKPGRGVGEGLPRERVRIVRKDWGGRVVEKGDGTVKEKEEGEEGMDEGEEGNGGEDKGGSPGKSSVGRKKRQREDEGGSLGAYLQSGGGPDVKRERILSWSQSVVNDDEAGDGGSGTSDESAQWGYVPLSNEEKEAKKVDADFEW